MITREQFESACVDQRKAKAIEKAAKEMKEAARLVILAYARENPECFPTAADSETGKTVEYRDPRYPPIEHIKAVRVTYPESKPLPARFDADRADECVAILDDTVPDAVDALFEKHYAFRGPEAVVAFSKEHPEFAAEMAKVMLPFTLPAKEAESLSPRVEVS